VGVRVLAGRTNEGPNTPSDGADLGERCRRLFEGPMMHRATLRDASEPPA